MTALSHPAKFSENVLTALRFILDERDVTGWILDPFAGTGRIHQLAKLDLSGEGRHRITKGVELEPEWAAMSPYTHLGDATSLPEEWTKTFAAIVTSPPYANRMADAYAGDARGSRRHTYRIALGRPLTTGSAASLQWGMAYQDTIAAALREMDRVLCDGGLSLLNLSNHIRKGALVPVIDWYLRECSMLGWKLVDEVPVVTPRNRMGANSELRDTSEWIIVLEKP